MTTKLSTEDFISKAKKIHGDKYDYSKVVYINNQTKVIITCKQHGDFEQTPNCHLSGRGCFRCYGHEKLTTEEFKKRSKEAHGGKYNYDKSVYKNRRTDIIVTCLKHGDFLIEPRDHFCRKIGCPKCRREENFKNFVTWANKIHNNKYVYDENDYKDWDTKTKITCPLHGVFLQEPNDHISKKAGCPTCGGCEKLNTEKFITRSRSVHGNKYDYSKTIYVNAETDVIIICHKHGEFLSNPNHHFHSAAGCPKCSSSKGELLVAKILKDHNIEFAYQKTFDGCRNIETNYMLKFDFFLPALNTLIEYNGKQHYEKCSTFFHKHGRTLESQQHRDAFKKEYALSHGFKFIVIRYDEDIEAVLRETVLKDITDENQKKAI